MTKIAAVKTSNSNTALWFDSMDVDASPGDKLIVETSRGLEIGVLDSEIFEASEKEIKNLNSELKPVKRKANKEDIIQAQEMEQAGIDAMEKFIEIAAETNKDMVPISVEYLFDGKKAVFYFSAPERQDFRDLVKKLSYEFHIRVDMRQINERDKSAMVSGIGSCGQELCCARLGRCPKHVSIKQAKVQGMSLNPENISGMCGKLLCCLDYEYETYKEFSEKAPKLKAKVLTPEGEAIVTDVNMPKARIEVKLIESEKRVKVSLADMIIDKKFAKQNGNNTDNVKPNKIEKDVWENAQNENTSFSLESVYTSTSLEGSEKLATGVVKTLPGAKLRDRKSKTFESKNENNRKHTNKNRNRNHKKRNRHNSFDKTNAYENNTSTRTRRRSRKIGTGGVRPGQNSSGSNSKE